MPDQEDAVWLSWHDHPRSRSLSHRLGVSLLVFDRYMSGFRRHLLGTVWTILVLASNRPRAIYLQNSFMLLLVCAAYKSLPGFRDVRIVVDCHNKSLRRRVQGFGGRAFWALKRWSFRRADAVIVSNRRLVSAASVLCSRVLCLRDPLPDLGVGDSRDADATPPPASYVLFVCSFEPDEPREIIVETAALLTQALELSAVITGPSSEIADHKLVDQNPRIQLPGFVPRPRYEALLKGAAAVVVLTEDEDCLMCGAYEAMSAGRPLVVSNTGVLRDYFGGYASLCDHVPAELVSAVRSSQRTASQKLVEARARFARAFEQEWQQVCDHLDAGDRTVSELRHQE